MPQDADEPTNATPAVAQRPLLQLFAEPPPAFDATPALEVAQQYIEAAREEGDRDRRRQLLMFARWALDDACEATAKTGTPAVIDETLALLAELERNP